MLLPQTEAVDAAGSDGNALAAWTGFCFFRALRTTTSGTGGGSMLAFTFPLGVAFAFGAGASKTLSGMGGSLGGLFMR